MLLNGLGEQELCLHPNVDCTALPAIGSDHSPLLLSFNLRMKRKKRAFKYEAFWSDNEECGQLVKNTWAELESQNLNMVEKLAQKCRRGMGERGSALEGNNSIILQQLV